MRTVALAMCGAAVLLGSEVVAQNTLPDIVRRRQGPVETLIVREFSPVGLPELVAASDVIARVVIVGEGRSRLSADKLSVTTDYSVQVVETYAAKEVLDGRTLVVTKPGGEMTVEGFPVASYERDFPPFTVGEEYVLFLRADARNNAFVLPDGGQGAFRNLGGSIEQMSTKFGTWNHERGRMGLTGFADELREVLRNRQQER